MIEEIYILDNDKNVLYGDPCKIKPVLDPEGESSLLLATLHCNKVFLGALYTEFQPLHVVQLLKLISRHLPADLDPEKVRKRYFAIFEMLRKHCINDVFLKEAETTQIISASILKSTSLVSFGTKNEVFLDVLEQFSAILDTNLGVIRSDIVGKIICRTSMASPLEIQIPIRHSDKSEFLSNNRSSYNGQVRTFKAMGHGSFVLGCYVNMDVAPPVLLQRTEEGYELILKRAMERVKVTVPVQRTAYNVHASVDKGTAKYVEKRSVVEWAINDPGVTSLGMKLRVEFLDKKETSQPIKLEFTGPGNMSSLVVKSVKANVRVDSYVKYRIESRNYEIRDSPG